MSLGLIVLFMLFSKSTQRRLKFWWQYHTSRIGSDSPFFFLSAPFELLYLPSICHWLKDAPHFEHIKILSVQVVFKFSTNYSKMCQKMKKWSICEEWRCLTCCMSWTWLIYFESIVAIAVYILLYSPEYPRCPTRRPSKCSDNVTGQYAVSRGGCWSREGWSLCSSGGRSSRRNAWWWELRTCGLQRETLSNSRDLSCGTGKIWTGVLLRDFRVNRQGCRLHHWGVLEFLSLALLVTFTPELFAFIPIRLAMNSPAMWSTCWGSSPARDPSHPKRLSEWFQSSTVSSGLSRRS